MPRGRPGKKIKNYNVVGPDQQGARGSQRNIKKKLGMAFRHKSVKRNEISTEGRMQGRLKRKKR